MVYNEKLNVESKFDDVADIVPGKENFRINARVVRMWKVPHSSISSSPSRLRWCLLMKKYDIWNPFMSSIENYY
jgi:hypothetical protein